MSCMQFLVLSMEQLFLVASMAALFVMVPITVFSLGVTKWGMKWQNERYVRSAENQDDIGDLKTTIKDLERRISELEEK